MNLDEEEIIAPFEWLTNFSSLSKLLDPVFLFREFNTFNTSFEKEDCIRTDLKNLTVLHIGCGSSTLGENITRRYRDYDIVINVDNDRNVLHRMSIRWKHLMNKWSSNSEETISTCLWKHLDFNNINFDDGEDKETANDFQLQRNSFDLVVDKSTLDCALCSDDATSGLIYNVYNSLKPDGGVYFVISFHHSDFILPMLKDCPGLDWDIRHFVVPRKVDSPADIDIQNIAYRLDGDVNDQYLFEEQKYATSPSHSLQSSWSNTEGTFQPDDSYGKVVNVFICKRRLCQKGDYVQYLDRNAMRIHIHDCNDLHYKNHNPMVTHMRKEQIKKGFLKHLNVEEESNIDNNHKVDNGIVELRVCYDILFTEAEKEHLTYDYFLEDYNAFKEDQKNSRGTLEKGMTLEQAILFLETMQ